VAPCEQVQTTLRVCYKLLICTSLAMATPLGKTKGLQGQTCECCKLLHKTDTACHAYTPRKKVN
jgi:hypothetical protein